MFLLPTLGSDSVLTDNGAVLAGAVTVVPEVSTASLAIAAGCLGLALLRRARRSTSA